MAVKEQSPKEARRRALFETITVIVSIFGLGLLRGQEGVVFLDLCLLLHIDIERGSLLFLLSALGYMAGALVAGVLADKTSPKVVYTVSILGAGGFCFLIPFCKTLPLMGFSMLIRSCFAGGMGTVGMYICTKIWKTKANTVLQMINFNFAIGALSIPLITEPFLATKNVNSSGMTNFSGNATTGSMWKPDSTFLNASNENQTQDFLASISTQSPKTDVYVSFVITGVYILVSSMPLLVYILWNRLKPDALNGTPGKEKVKPAFRKGSVLSSCKTSVVVVNALIFLLNMTYGSVETSFATYLMPFGVDFLNMGKAEAAYLTSAFWGAYAASRGIGVVASKFLDEIKMLLVIYGLLFIGISLFFLHSTGSLTPIWAASVVTGAGMAGVFPTLSAWINSKVKPVTGFLSAMMAIAYGLGSLPTPPLLGYLFEHVSPFWLIYLGIGNTALCFAIFIILYVLNQKKVFFVDTKKIGVHEEINILSSH